MKISVLIPTYNRRDLVCRALDQILLYNGSELHEVIVSDNHSDDGSKEYLEERYREYRKIKIVQPPEKCSPLKNWKYCLDQSSGSHIHWHWSDDCLTSNFYKKAAELHNRDGQNVICAPVRIKHEDGFNPVFYSQGFDRSMDSNSALECLFTSGRFPYSPAAYILPRNSVINHFYEDIPDYGDLRPVEIAMGPDALMIAGALMDNSTVGFCDEPMMEFMKHAGSITEQNIHSFKCYHLSFAYFIAKNNYQEINLRTQKNTFGNDIVRLFGSAPADSETEEVVKPQKKNFFSWLLSCRLKN